MWMVVYLVLSFTPIVVINVLFYTLLSYTPFSVLYMRCVKPLLGWVMNVIVLIFMAER